MVVEFFRGFVVVTSGLRHKSQNMREHLNLRVCSFIEQQKSSAFRLCYLEGRGETLTSPRRGHRRSQTLFRINKGKISMESCAQIQQTMLQVFLVF